MARVVCTPGVCGGRPRIDYARTTVGNFVLDLQHGLSFEDAIANLGLQSSIYLTEAPDIHAILRYCSEKRCVGESPDNFCGPCVLCDDQDPEEPEPYRIWEFAANLLKS
jgi:uncharacterized protein (DUF433 family)